jgi:hypothetical protein
MVMSCVAQAAIATAGGKELLAAAAATAAAATNGDGRAPDTGGKKKKKKKRTAAEAAADAADATVGERLYTFWVVLQGVCSLQRVQQLCKRVHVHLHLLDSNPVDDESI